MSKEYMRSAKMSRMIDDEETLIERLQAENEKLKKEVETWSYQAEKRDEIGDTWFDIADKYRKALEEIREIAELEVIIFDNKPLFPTNIQRILNKIDEVLNLTAQIDR